MSDAAQIEDKRGAEMFWHGVREIGLPKILAFIVTVAIVSSSTSWAVAAWTTDLAASRDVTQNTDSIRANRDSILAHSDALARQDRTLLGLIGDVENLGGNYCRVIAGQNALSVQMDRLLCRMDGNTPNRCDLLHRITPVSCGGAGGGSG